MCKGEREGSSGNRVQLQETGRKVLLIEVVPCIDLEEEKERRAQGVVPRGTTDMDYSLRLRHVIGRQARATRSA